MASTPWIGVNGPTRETGTLKSVPSAAELPAEKMISFEFGIHAGHPSIRGSLPADCGVPCGLMPDNAIV
jgi:hypothetical protein